MVKNYKLKSETNFVFLCFFFHLFRSIGASLPEVLGGWAGKEGKLRSVGIELIRDVLKEFSTFKRLPKRAPNTRFRLVLKYVIADRAAV